MSSNLDAMIEPRWKRLNHNSAFKFRILVGIINKLKITKRFNLTTAGDIPEFLLNK